MVSFTDTGRGSPAYAFAATSRERVIKLREVGAVSPALRVPFFGYFSAKALESALTFTWHSAAVPHSAEAGAGAT